MSNANFKIRWSKIARNDLAKLEFVISDKMKLKILRAPRSIIFPEQFQIDQYRLDCRRIIVGNYKVLYQFNNDIIRIVRVFNSLHHPEKSLF